jgi:hypothetical protein
VWPSKPTDEIDFPFGLRESRFSNSAFSTVLPPRIHDLSTRGLLESTVTIPSGIRGSKISTFLARFFPECSNQSTRSVDVCPPTDRWSSAPSALRASGISKLNFASFTFSRSVFPRTAQISATRPSGNRWPGSSSALGSSAIWFPSQPQTPEVIHSGVVDRAPPVSLDDGRSLLTSGLRDFDKSALLRSSKGLTFMHLSLDPTTVDPRCSDPMDQICTSPGSNGCPNSRNVP